MHPKNHGVFEKRCPKKNGKGNGCRFTLQRVKNRGREGLTTFQWLLMVSPAYSTRQTSCTVAGDHELWKLPSLLGLQWKHADLHQLRTWPWLAEVVHQLLQVPPGLVEGKRAEERVNRNLFRHSIHIMLEKTARKCALERGVVGLGFSRRLINEGDNIAHRHIPAFYLSDGCCFGQHQGLGCGLHSSL